MFDNAKLIAERWKNIPDLFTAGIFKKLGKMFIFISWVQALLQISDNCGIFSTAYFMLPITLLLILPVLIGGGFFMIFLINIAASWISTRVVEDTKKFCSN